MRADAPRSCPRSWAGFAPTGGTDTCLPVAILAAHTTFPLAYEELGKNSPVSDLPECIPRRVCSFKNGIRYNVNWGLCGGALVAYKPAFCGHYLQFACVGVS